MIFCSFPRSAFRSGVCKMGGKEQPASNETAPLVRGIGPWQATALNVTMIVGAGVFGVIPDMLGVLPGPYALLGWLAAGALILVDGMVWSELGAAIPGSGGSYQYLLECYGRERWGRLAAFLFIWQFLISGPLELASGLVFIAQFSTAFSPAFEQFNKEHSGFLHIWEEQKLTMWFGPSRLLGFVVGLGIIGLLWRNITSLGKLTITFWIGVLATIAWILVEGWARFDPARAFNFSGEAAVPPDLGTSLGPAMVFAMYAYLGYYNVCYIGDEVHDPGRTIPRSILWSVVIVCLLFVGIHLAILGTVPWQEVPPGDPNLPARFMSQIHGQWAATLITALLIWCVIGSAFAGLLGYSRIPYGAAHRGHFFSFFDRVHPQHRIPHVSLLLVGGLMLFWSFFDLENIIKALIITRILEQFVMQILGVMLLRRTQPELQRPYRIWLYPLPCLLALTGWLYMYFTADRLFIFLGLGTMAAGIVAFFIWSWHTRGWPFSLGSDLDARHAHDSLQPSPESSPSP
jgi:amino acid transporter